MKKMSENRIKRLAHIGVGGQKGWIYSVNSCSPTLPATQYKDPTKLDNEYRIRKLTPKECWRLMGFSDDAFEKAKSSGVSDTQLYKQAGNSIVTDVLYYIFKELYNVMPYLFDDLKVGSYFSGIGAFEIGLDRLYAGINNENFIQPQTV